jgi:hypothetical protein
VILYASIAMVIPIYAARGHMQELHQYQLLFWVIVLCIGATILFMGIVMPLLVQNNKNWLADHKGLIRILLLSIFTIIGLLKLWGVIFGK